ncbi:hypothetical protein V2J09_016911 [Rumex salicifolius]
MKNSEEQNIQMSIATILLLSLIVSISGSDIGVNYGTLGNNLPSATTSIDLIKSINGSGVKIYGAQPEILKALNGTNLQVSVMIPNNLIINISTNQSMADEWIRINILPYYPQIHIRYLLVGNEILSDQSIKQTWFSLVPAMKRIKFSLRTFNITKVKVGTSMAMDVLESSFPPSNGTFRTDISDSVLKPMLHFLRKIKSYYFIDCYPYFAWSQDYQNIKLDYALFNGKSNYTDPVSGLVYTNLLDQMLDAVVFAMRRLGVDDLKLFIAETGWPNGCDIEQIGGNPHNAAIYNRNLVKRLTTNPPIGTPARPGESLPTFIFSLYNENQKPGQGTERHWGVFYPNGTNVYPIDLSGKTPLSSYPSIPQGNNNVPYKGKVWCVVDSNANTTLLGNAMTYACSQGNGTCDAIQPGKECYRLNQLVLHASYAFSSYWAKFRSQGATCLFSGLAMETTTDPSRGSCKYPSITIS